MQEKGSFFSQLRYHLTKMKNKIVQEEIEFLTNKKRMISSQEWNQFVVLYQKKFIDKNILLFRCLIHSLYQDLPINSHKVDFISEKMCYITLSAIMKQLYFTKNHSYVTMNVRA
ncbi:MAG: hypothetical protein MJB14_00105 [Spirochaetes bacterium]|nr:hypothetical protein [Spirochaetota bacterium]